MLGRKAAGETEGTAKWVRKESFAWVKSISNFMFTSHYLVVVRGRGRLKVRTLGANRGSERTMVSMAALS